MNVALALGNNRPCRLPSGNFKGEGWILHFLSFRWLLGAVSVCVCACMGAFVVRSVLEVASKRLGLVAVVVLDASC